MPKRPYGLSGKWVVEEKRAQKTLRIIREVGRRGEKYSKDPRRNNSYYKEVRERDEGQQSRYEQ